MAGRWLAALSWLCQLSPTSNNAPMQQLAATSNPNIPADLRIVLETTVRLAGCPCAGRCHSA